MGARRGRDTLVRHGRLRGRSRGHSPRADRFACARGDSRRRVDDRMGRRRSPRADDRPGGSRFRGGMERRGAMTTMDRDEAMDASAVADYLKDNPAFFEQYADLLAEIFVPHPHGGRAIPIAERQIVTLREKNAQLETKLEELIQFGSENDAISEKLHRSTLALFAAPDLETTLGVLYHSLLDDFRVPQVSLRLWGKVPEQSYLPELAATSQELREYAAALDEPYCGTQAPFESRDWFDAKATLKSFAFLPLPPAMLRRFLAALHARGLSGRSLARVLSGWRAFYRFALERDPALKDDPCAGLKAPKSARRLPAALSPDEAVRLVTIEGDDPLSIRDRALFELAYSSGLRLSELSGLDVDSVDLATGEVRVWGKGSKERIVPVGAAAGEAIRAWLQVRDGLKITDAGAMFLSRSGRRIAPRAIEKRLAEWAIKRGLGR